MARNRRQKRKTIESPSPLRNFHFSAAMGLLRGMAMGALFAGTGIGWLLSGGPVDSSSNSSSLTLSELPLVILYAVAVGGFAYVGYLVGGWSLAIGLPCSVGAFIGGIGGALGCWKLRNKL